MSGFEIAGVVLGAFPIAISALCQYREAAVRIGFWRHIQVEYLKSSHELGIQYAMFKSNLRKLLMPLVVADDKIDELLADPGGVSWRHPKMETILADRLQDSHVLYLECIEGFQAVLEDVNKELAIYSDSVQAALKSPKAPISLARFRRTVGKEGREFELYKLKFSNGEATRTRLFDQLKSYNEQLEKLLSISDENAQLLQKRSLAAKFRVKNAVLCSFWLQARKFFRALAATWNCYCNPPEHHYVRLLLQHRPSTKPEFNVVFAKPVQSSWEIRKTRIAEDEPPPASIAVTTTPGAVSVAVSCTMLSDSLKADWSSAVMREPSHRQKRAMKSALKAQTTEKPIPSVTITTADDQTLSDKDDNPISSLCVSLEKDGPCCGYMSLPDEPGRFYVYPLSKLGTKAFMSLTLDELLRHHIQPLRRPQRNHLALILSSSFLQLLDTPWLPESWKRSDIVFISDAASPGVFSLDQPHLCRDIVPSSSTGAGAEATEKNGIAWATTDAARASTDDTLAFLRSLDLLGILLLELCFGRLLEDQPGRRRLPAGGTEAERIVFDIMAARDWQVDVNGEAGPDYADAVSWCFGGSRNTPPDILRQEMLRNVIQPLERCHLYLGVA